MKVTGSARTPFERKRLEKCVLLFLFVSLTRFSGFNVWSVAVPFRTLCYKCTWDNPRSKNKLKVREELLLYQMSFASKLILKIAIYALG